MSDGRWTVLGWDPSRPGTAVLLTDRGRAVIDPAHPSLWETADHGEAERHAATLTANRHLGLRWKPLPKGTPTHEQQAADWRHRDRRAFDGYPEGW